MLCHNSSVLYPSFKTFLNALSGLQLPNDQARFQAPTCMIGPDDIAHFFTVWFRFLSEVKQNTS